MRFERGKSLQDPIYLRKKENDFWMEGDVYEEFCKCLDQIFGGRKRYFVNGFSPKMVDFLTKKPYYRVIVTDFEGDVHSFFGRVVDSDEFDVSQRGGNFRDKVVEEIQTLEAPPPEEPRDRDDTPEGPSEETSGRPVIEEPQESGPDDQQDSESSMKEELDAVRRAMKQEVEIETLNAEFGDEEKQLTRKKRSAKLPRKKRTTTRKKSSADAT